MCLINHVLCVTDEAIFEKAQEFIPERWYQYPDMVKDKNAFAPFLLGMLHVTLVLLYRTGRAELTRRQVP